MTSGPIDTFELLAKTSVASGMSLEQIRILAEAGQVASYKDGEALVTWDDPEFDLLVVLEGKCEIRTMMQDVLYQLGPSSLIGEVSFMDHKPRSATAIAIGECRVLRFPATLLNDLEATHPDIAVRLLVNIGIVLCQKLRSTTRFAEATFV